MVSKITKCWRSWLAWVWIATARIADGALAPGTVETDLYAKCTESEAQLCGADPEYRCTAVAGPRRRDLPKVVCECREGYSLPLVRAYEEAFAPAATCRPCQEENTVYYGYNLKVRLGWILPL